MLNIALVEPEIPQNTGNISRTCAVTGTSLHLIRPLGFTIDDKHLKRAGLDYWPMLDLHYYDSYADFEKQRSASRMWFFSTHAEKLYTDVEYKDGDFLVFGKETAGLGQAILSRHPECAVRLPMRPELRSLNLSNAAAIALYEALRQLDFPDLK